MNWIEREIYRYSTGKYHHIPPIVQGSVYRDRKLLQIPAHHYPHVSPNNPELIAFTAHPEQGEKDIKRELRPGKYLRKYFPELNDVEIEAYTVQYSNENTPLPLKLSKDGDESEEITVYGPPNCMNSNDWASAIHPHQVYSPADGTDLTIAYIGEDTENVRAFSIVWPEKKIFSKYYGDDRIIKSLENAGYSHDKSNSDWYGAKILKIEENGYTVMPYIDQAPSVSESPCGKFFILDSCGEHSTKSTDGALSRNTCCACSQDAGENYQTYDNDIYCDECFCENFDYCNHCEKSYHRDSGGGWLEHEEISLCDYCYGEESADCVETDERHLKENMTEIVDEDGETGEFIHPEAIADSEEYYQIDGLVYHIDYVAFTEKDGILLQSEAGQCVSTGQVHPLENLEEIDGELYCQDAISAGQLELDFG